MSPNFVYANIHKNIFSIVSGDMKFIYNIIKINQRCCENNQYHCLVAFYSDRLCPEKPPFVIPDEQTGAFLKAGLRIRKCSFL